jgi:hypothetical protein
MRGRSGPKRGVGETRNLVRELHARGLTGAAIAERLGINRSTVVYHLRNLDKPLDERFARRYDWTEIREAYDSGLSARDCRAKFGCARAAWAAAVRRGEIVPRPHVIPIEEFLVVGRVGTNRTYLKTRLIAEGLKEDRCEECGLGDWRGRPLAIELHHINGDGTDNRLVNLKLLCPNCHAQTETWGGRNGHRRKRAV